MTLTGAQLVELLESQWSRVDSLRVRFLQPSRGFSYAWSASTKVGGRIIRDSLRLDGQPIRPGDALRITVNSYLAEGGDGFRTFRTGRDVIGGPLDVDAFVAFIQISSANAPLTPVHAPRIERRD